jgi:hypothetical protein
LKLNISTRYGETCGKKGRQLILIGVPLWLDVRGSMHHVTIHKEKSNKMQQRIKILLFLIYMKLNMFRATHRPSSGA